MIDTKLTKLFKDPNTGADIYILSIQIEDQYYNIPVTKTQFDDLFLKLRAVYNNSELE